MDEKPTPCGDATGTPPLEIAEEVIPLAFPVACCSLHMIIPCAGTVLTIHTYTN